MMKKDFKTFFGGFTRCKQPISLARLLLAWSLPVITVSRWLSKHQIEVVLVNPHLVKKNKENRDNTPSKSDKKDALVIADMVKNGYCSFIRNTPEAFEELRVFLSNRDSVVTRLVSTKNQIHRWVDVVFPELRQVFKDLMCKGSHWPHYVFSRHLKNWGN
jgi:hypothetical protein